MPSIDIAATPLGTAGILSYTPEVAERTAPLLERMRGVIPEIEWRVHAPYIAEIERLIDKYDSPEAARGRDFKLIVGSFPLLKPQGEQYDTRH